MQLFTVFCFSFVSAAAVLTSNGIAIITPHRSTTYVDAPIVTDGVAWSVSRSVCHDHLCVI